MSDFMFLMLVFGTTELLISSKIMDPVRKKLKKALKKLNISTDFLSCSQCIGFWIGFWYALILNHGPIGYGIAGSGFTFLMHSVLHLVIDLKKYYRLKIMGHIVD